MMTKGQLALLHHFLPSIVGTGAFHYAAPVLHLAIALRGQLS